jgi:hypothetical protein
MLSACQPSPPPGRPPSGPGSPARTTDAQMLTGRRGHPSPLRPAPSPAPGPPATPDSGHQTTRESSPDYVTIALDRCTGHGPHWFARHRRRPPEPTQAKPAAPQVWSLNPLRGTIVLVTLPGWRVPGASFSQAQTIPCPFGHGYAAKETDHSARCDQCPSGWFMWAACPRCGKRAASLPGGMWRCVSGQCPDFVGRLCPECWHVGLPPTRGEWWTCTGPRHHRFAPARDKRTCVECKYGYPVIGIRARQWVCSACGAREKRRGG